MAIYKIFPEQDSFIWSEQQTQNMGRDEILEISTFDDPRPTEGNLNKIPSATRALIKFKNSQLKYFAYYCCIVGVLAIILTL